MEHESHSPVKRKHPLPWLCWLWPLGGICLVGFGVMILVGYSDRQNLWAHDSAKFPPPADPQWNFALLLGVTGIVAGLAYWWHWYRFAIRRALTRKTWHIGIGLILTGAAILFLAGLPVPGVVFLLVLAVWAQGFTRQHFDKL